MSAKNHPLFFPLLKKLLVVSINRENKGSISKVDKEQIRKLVGDDIGWNYLDKVITKEIYSSKSQNSIGKRTLNALVGCLPNEWGYGNSWDAFCQKNLEELNDKELTRDLPNRDYETMEARHKDRIKEEIEGIAQRLLSLKNDTEVIPREITEKQERSVPMSIPFLWGKTWILTSAIVVVVLVIVFYNKKETSNQDYSQLVKILSEEERILSVVENSIRLEFKAYKNVENYEDYLDSLKRVYGVNELKRVEKTLKGCFERNWRLSNDGNPSNSFCLNKQLDSISSDGNVAYVSTLESWLIQWYNPKTKQEEYTYDVINQQRYFLRKESDTIWKVIDIIYSGNAPKSLPKNYHYEDMVDLVEVTPHQFNENILEALTQGNLEQAIAMLRFYIEYKSNDFEMDENYLVIIELSSRFKAAQRALNTKKATAKSFDAVKKEILKKVCKLHQIIMNKGGATR